MRHIFQKRLPPLPYCNEVSKLNNCLECSTSPCILACPKRIIVKDERGIYLDFSSDGCVFCEDCANVCKESGLDILDLGFKQIKAVIKLDELTCFAWNKTMCKICLDNCLINAINFIGGFYPSIAESCTKCGLCVAPCPTFAITIKGY